MGENSIELTDDLYMLNPLIKDDTGLKHWLDPDEILNIFSNINSILIYAYIFERRNFK